MSDASPTGEPRQTGIVWLIGMMGAGKTTVGRILAERLGRSFIDLDRRVEEVAGRSVSEIFSRDGESVFRALEARLASELAAAAGEVGPVVATGGGTPCHGDTLERMRSSGVVVWLRAEIDELLRHLDLAHRPLLRDAPDPRLRLAELEAVRRRHYQRADVVVNRAGREAAAVAAEIVAWMQAYGAAPLAAPALGDTSIVEVALGERTYPVHIDPSPGAERRFVAQLGRRLPPGRTRLVLISDEQVARLHGWRYLAALQQRGYQVISLTVPPGEASKSMATAAEVAQQLAVGGLDRRSAVVALGGGVVGDLGGFVASILYRGIAFVQLPTTLLAQVDASVGGKTGVNLPAGKNLVGSFHQPLMVYADVTALATLDRRDLASGLAEVAKHALLDGGALLERLEAEAEAAATGEPRLLAELVAASCVLKAQVVADDEREQREDGGRALLNLGHTVGHALESASQRGPDPWRHGEAVALGLVAAARVSRALGGAQDLERRVVRLLERLGLPADLDRHLGREVLSGVAVDKKRAGNDVRFVVLDAPGRARLVRLPISDLMDILCPAEVSR